MQPWNTPHQKAGDPEPKPNPDKVMVYNMRYVERDLRISRMRHYNLIIFDV